MLLEPWEWVIVISIIVGVVIVSLIFFWEGVVKSLRGVARAEKKPEDPAPRVDYTKFIWNDSPIGLPPAKKTVVLSYDTPEKVTMSFFADLTNSGNCYLDLMKPIRVNGELVEIKDLPTQTEKLRVIKKDAIDVTKLIRTDSKGIPNDFEVNYVAKGWGPRLGRRVGKLTLVLSVTMPKAGGVVGPTRFCMSCQYSSPATANFCPNCGVPVEAFSGTETATCVNCKENIPGNAVYCPSCGAAQPGKGVPIPVPAVQTVQTA